MIRFYFPFYAKVDDLVGQIYKLLRAESCFGIQEIFWLRNLFLLNGIGCEKVCSIIDNAKSLSLVEEVTKFVVLIELALLEVRDPSQLHFYSLVEFSEY